MRKPATRPKMSRNKEAPDDARHILQRDYRHLLELTARGWCDQLRSLYELSIDHNLGLHTEDPKIVRRVLFKGKTRIFLPGAPVVQLVEPESEDVLIPRHLLPVLVVNINAPDEIILAQFKLRLMEAREKFPSGFSKPGPKAANGSFGERSFLSWCNARIVPLAELLAWNAERKARGEDYYPDVVLGSWIGLSNKGSTHRSKEVLMAALASMPALAAQIKYDLDPDRVAAMNAEAQQSIDPSDRATAAAFEKGM